MPTMSFCFQGHNRRAEIETAYNVESGEKVDVSDMSREELADKLNKGEMSISLAEHLEDAAEIEIHDFE